MTHPDYLLENYDYLLPNELIAQYPSNPPHQAKLLHCQLQLEGKKRMTAEAFLRGCPLDIGLKL